MYLIAGLGNPGEKYVSTRHNMGFSAIDYISQKNNIDVKKVKHKAIIGEGRLGGEKVVLAKPQTFMNLSGDSIREIADWYKIDNDKIIILYDDISLPVGTIRIREKGSAGGHNGIKSIILNLNSDVFGRIKIGVGEKPSGWDLADYVLGHFSEEDQVHLKEVMPDIISAAVLVAQGDADKAMNDYNAKKQG